MPYDDITALAEIALGWRDPDLGVAVTVLLSDKLHSVKPVKTLCCFGLHVIVFVYGGGGDRILNGKLLRIYTLILRNFFLIFYSLIALMSRREKK